ncbi:glycosyltransferase family 2 protein [Pseudoxanthomonas sp. UTMC 1351]|uniref:glycosyltransferase family 2 protein n=1 Tax=Pseudoxanthomonas sp. UTMC 1351 TaxID=2695853 RepID=UPI0034CEDAB5
MKTIFFFSMCAIVLAYLLAGWRRKASKKHSAVDAIIPAFNEEPCLESSLTNLLQNPYIHRVICVNDGSTDDTAGVLARMADKWDGRLIAVNQANTGKGGAIMNGLRYVTADQVFLSDADTYVPHDKDGLGYMLAEIEAGADAVGGIPSSNLRGAGLLPCIRATVKLPMIIIKRTFQQLLGGAPFLISGACGMFRTEVLRKNAFSDRTKVEDLDLTWTLVTRGYKIRQANRCIVYPQECNTLRDEWKRWRRWIVGYAVCMRLHKRLLFTRYGIGSILPMVMVVFLGLWTYATSWANALIENGPAGLAFVLFPLLWVAVVMLVGAFSAAHHRKWALIPLAPLAVFYVLLAYSVWLVHGLKGLVTGKEPMRDKPTRYRDVVENA